MLRLTLPLPLGGGFHQHSKLSRPSGASKTRALSRLISRDLELSGAFGSSLTSAIARNGISCKPVPVRSDVVSRLLGSSTLGPLCMTIARKTTNAANSAAIKLVGCWSFSALLLSNTTEALGGLGLNLELLRPFRGRLFTSGEPVWLAKEIVQGVEL